MVTVALANRSPVQFDALPSELANLVGLSWSITLPLFLIIFISIAAGILIGFVWEWLREVRFRSAAATERRARQKLEREVRSLKTDEGKGDDVLAILNDAARR